MPVHALFDQQVLAGPDRVAITGDAGAMTYRELAGRADRLRHVLAARGVRSGDFVGLLARRGPDTIAAMLASLGRGAAFVPLDPAYPSEQLALMAGDCSPKIVFASPDLLERARAIAGRGAEILELTAAGSGAHGTTPGLPVDGGDPAYVMYTSGSTGRPKGVLVPHRAVVRLVREQNFANLRPDDVILHMAPLAFDASTLEIWGALLNGGRLVIIEDDRPTLDRIGATLIAHGVTTAWFTSGIFNLMVDHKLADLRGLRQLLAGGDVLSPDHVGRAMAALPGCRIVNGYGPTENTTFSCCYPVPRTGWGAGPVPIGRPIAHSTAHILDEAFKPVRDGEIGQLCTGGDGVAIGYLNLPEQTAAKFIADPFAADPGARLYLTGDMARRRPDGVIEFLGRADRQIKLHGRRIEPGEIEHALRADEDIEDAVVVVTESEAGKALVAFVKPSGTAASALVERVGRRLRRTLPSFAIPNRILVLDSLPLNTAGKVDRKRLAALAQASPKPAAPAARSASPDAAGTAQLVQRVWRSVLKRDEVGLRQNFFDLGGNSLQLIDVHNRLQDEIGCPIDIVALFQYPKIEDLVNFLDGGARAPARALAPVAGRDARRTASIALARQRRL